MAPRGTGALGEAFAAARLTDWGWDILARNWSCRFGELDIVARRGEILAFIEVKTREERGMVRPAAAITAQKRRKISASARCFLAAHPLDLQPRFDAFEVYTRPGPEGEAVCAYNYIEGAFDYDGPF